MDSQQASPMNQIGPTTICLSSEDGRFIMWTQAGREQFVEISYAQIKLSIADITVV
jgi:hypothetical protein